MKGGKKGNLGLVNTEFSIMTRFIMNFLKTATLAFLMTGLAMTLMAENWDHEQLTTVEGRAYHEVSVIESDATGLTFRHRDGVAKLPFATLSQSYRMLYEGLENVDDLSTEETSGVHPDGIGPRQSQKVSANASSFSKQMFPLVAEARTLVRLPLGAPSFMSVADCRGSSPVVFWPGWWPDHRYGYFLTRPAGRERVVREFLLLSGLCR